MKGCEILNKDIILDESEINNNIVEVNDMKDVNELKEYTVNTKMEHDVEFYILDLEEEMDKDLANNNGFVITAKKGLDRAEKERTEDGIYSPKFGSVFGDEDAFKELYRCECGEFKGKIHKGEICPICSGEVTYKDKNVNMTGWFYIESYSTIHPQMFEFVSSLIGTKLLDNILKPEWETDDDGNTIKPVVDMKSKNINRYEHIGMLEFQSRFEEICEFFYSKRKAKKEVYDFIIENKDKVFTSALPTHALFLRPLVITDEDMDYLPINKKYASLSTKIYNLNNKYSVITDKNEKIVLNTLYGVLKKYEEVTAFIYETLSTKNGHIRSNILGSKLNHSGRFVITPLSGSKINQVDMPYLGFLTEFKPEIINITTKIMNITVSEANILWHRANQKFDKRMYDIMTYIVENYKTVILLNRNPTLNYGGILEMVVRRIKPDYSDLSLSIPINILNILAGDFDGDALNTVSIKDKYLEDAFSIYNPRENMIIDKNDGLFNNSFNLIKEQLICLHEFCMIPRYNDVRLREPVRIEDYKPMRKMKIKKKKTLLDEKHTDKQNKKKKIKIRKRVV